MQREIIIKPNQGWFALDWRGILDYRDLLFLLVRRDFVSKYKQTILGPAWAVIQPLLTTLVFTVIFGRVAKIPTDGVPPMLFYMCGLLTWTYFSTALTSIGNSLQLNAGIFGKVYFPRLVPALALVLSNLIPFVIQFATFLGFLFYFMMFTTAGEYLEISWRWLFFVLFMVQTCLLALAFGLVLSSLTAKYRDFQHLLTFITQVWMYATPIIFPISQVPERFRWIAWMNPMAGVVEGTKASFLGTEFPDISVFVLSWAVTLVCLAGGLLIFQKVERSYIDTV
jgi:lipopolysaccharide transport system permease protein